MTTQLYDREFAPFTIDGARRIVASEDEWQRVRSFSRENGAVRIRVSADVFEPWDGSMTNGNGEKLEVNRATWWEPYRADYRHGAEYRVFAKMQRVRDRLFDLIDEYPNVTWMLETERPENVAVMMPESLTCQPAYGTCKRLKGHAGQHSQQPEYLPNLWLYARADSQAEADARIPHLLQCPAAARGLVMTPREDVKLCNVSGWKDKAYWWGRTIMGGDGINHVIIRGGDEPMHPDWVRSIIRQCDAAGVPVWFDGWGEWLPWRSECMNESHLSFAGFPMKRFSKKSGFVTESRNFDSAAEKDRFLFDECVNVARVGAARSGCVIDGREVKQLPEVTL